MTTQCTEQELEELLTELADSYEVVPPPWETVANRRNQPVPARSRRVLVAAVAAIAVVVLAGLVAVSDGSSRVTTAPAAIDEAIEGQVVLVPGVDGPAVSTSGPRPYAAFEDPRGAVAGPGGTVYALSLARSVGEEIRGEIVNLAGIEATVLTDESVPTQVYRTIDFGCVALTVTTASAPALSPEFTALVESMTASDDLLTIELPEGWTSYGAANSVDQYVSTLQVEADGSLVELYLRQSPGTPMGYYLYGETAPVLVASDGVDYLWQVAGANTPGLNTLTGTRWGTAFELTGLVPVDLLRAVVDTFTTTEAPDALAPSNSPGSDVATTETTEAQPATVRECPRGTPTLAITDHD